MYVRKKTARITRRNPGTAAPEYYYRMPGFRSNDHFWWITNELARITGNNERKLRWVTQEFQDVVFFFGSLSSSREWGAVERNLSRCQRSLPNIEPSGESACTAAFSGRRRGDFFLGTFERAEWIESWEEARASSISEDALWRYAKEK